MDPEEAERQKEEAFANLEKAGWKVRYVITHELPASCVALYSHGFYSPDAPSKFLEEVRCRLEYKMWFAGHYHDEKQITEKDAVLYNQIVRIW